MKHTTRNAVGRVIISALLAVATPISSAQEAATVDEWVAVLTGLENHNEAAFRIGPRLVGAPRDVALGAVRTAWPKIEDAQVRTGLLKAFHFGKHPDVLSVLHLGAADADPAVREYAFTYLRVFAWVDFNADPDAYAAWHEEFAEASVERTLEVNAARWVKRYLETDADTQASMRAELADHDLLGTPGTKTYRESVRRYAFNAGLPPELALVNDDASVERQVRMREDDVGSASPAESRMAGGDPNKRYFLIGDTADAPEKGFGLLLVLPGGDGGEDFHPFVKRLHEHWCPPGYLVAQLVAKAWSEDENRIVWPIATNNDDKAAFTTESFAQAVIADVRGLTEVDPERVFVLGWSSGGPAAYAVTLTKGSEVRGAFVLMSVFKPDFLPDLAGAEGKRFFILHSPDDSIPIAMAKRAGETLQAHGATTRFETYEGGHGWPQRLDVVRRAMHFLAGAR